ncbi:MAG TPA: hypothetical protein VGN14_11440 [Candidatus Elarobacter sp.]
MTIDLGLWNAVVSTVTLIVIAATAFIGLRQVRHLRGQNSLTALLQVLEDWRDPQLTAWVAYVRNELPERLKDPAYLAELEGTVDRGRHPELNVCDWYEQLGSYVKFGLLDERTTLDVACGPVVHLWERIEPCIERMRLTRGPSLYENFEYLAVRAVLYSRAHPHGTYPATTPRFSELRARDAAAAETT